MVRCLVQTPLQMMMNYDGVSGSGGGSSSGSGSLALVVHSPR